jgi:hypothetical protein
MIVTCYYTQGTPYEHEANECRKSAEAVGLVCDVRGYPHPGNWIKANLLNAQHILAVRRDHPGEPVLYVDADARFETVPTWLLDLEQQRPMPDLAVYYLPVGLAFAPVRGQPELLTGTTWWGPGLCSTAILEAWAVLNTLPEPRRGCDQLNLYWLLKACEGKGLNIAALPAEYVWIPDISPQQHLQHGPPVIVHGQASRRLKAVVDHV